jgi:hypothetical protein
MRSEVKLLFTLDGRTNRKSGARPDLADKSLDIHRQQISQHFTFSSLLSTLEWLCGRTSNCSTILAMLLLH